MPSRGATNSYLTDQVYQAAHSLTRSHIRLKHCLPRPRPVQPRSHDRFTTRGCVPQPDASPTGDILGLHPSPLLETSDEPGNHTTGSLSNVFLLKTGELRPVPFPSGRGPEWGLSRDLAQLACSFGLTLCAYSPPLTPSHLTLVPLPPAAVSGELVLLSSESRWAAQPSRGVRVPI